MRLLRRALALLVTAAVPVLGQQPIARQAVFGMTQPVLTGLLEVPAVTRPVVKGATMTAMTTARIRTNVPWSLRVSLVPPVNPALTASFKLGNGKAVALSATRPSATVTTGTTPCAACLVTLEWDFTYKSSGKTKVTPTAPALLFEALPTVRP
jgi:hypothetical protein